MTLSFFSVLTVKCTSTCYDTSVKSENVISQISTYIKHTLDDERWWHFIAWHSKYRVIVQITQTENVIVGKIIRNLIQTARALCLILSLPWCCRRRCSLCDLAAIFHLIYCEKVFISQILRCINRFNQKKKCMKANFFQLIQNPCFFCPPPAKNISTAVVVVFISSHKQRGRNLWFWLQQQQQLCWCFRKDLVLTHMNLHML